MNMVRLITEKDGRVYRFDADVLRLDDTSIKDYSRCRFTFKNPVPVFDSGHKMIGSAVLELIHNTIVGSFSIDYATPERLNIQCDVVPVYPDVEGASIVMVDSKERYMYYQIDGINLSMYPNEVGKIIDVKEE
jgi:hypothetical protein